MAKDGKEAKEVKREDLQHATSEESKDPKDPYVATDDDTAIKQFGKNGCAAVEMPSLNAEISAVKLSNNSAAESSVPPQPTLLDVLKAVQ